MKKSYLKITLLIFITAFYSCSSDNSNKESDPVITPPETDILTTSNVRSYMVDATATEETVALFYNLKKLSKTRFAIGQQDAFNAFYNDASGISDIKKTTTHDPALLGSDFMFITDKENNGQPSNWFHQQEVIITDDAKEAYTKGMINTFCWHLREPYHENSFYAADMTETEKANAFRSILPGGANHAWFKLKLDKVAEVVSSLKDTNGQLIPIIFRPFHEFDGSWFWWGANYCSPEEYKTAYKFVVDYLKNTKGVHNILYAFSPDNSYTDSNAYLSRYPGDDYVDILGMDNYGDFNNQGQTGASTANTKLKMISGLAITKVKIAALTETGYQVTAANAPVNGWFSNYLYNALTENDVQLSFVMFWNNSQNAYYVPTPSNPNATDFTNFVAKPKATLINNLPNMYALPN